MLKKHIVFVSSGQPSANPRLVKEAVACMESGFRVTVIYCPLSTWGDQFDTELFSEFTEIKWIRVGFHPFQNSLRFKYARVRRKLYEWLFKYIYKTPIIAWYSLVLFGQELQKMALKQNADLFIGHNLGSLPVVVMAAEKWKAKVGFDAEDFHRGESEEMSLHWQICKILETEFMPKLDYLSTSSPLIKKAYLGIFDIPIITINNVFSKKFLTTNIRTTKTPIRLFWFSQVIGKKRGIEDIIFALHDFSNKEFELTLLGNINEETENYFKDLAQRKDGTEVNIRFLNPVHPDEIFIIAQKHDIGLVIEPGRDVNNKLALSNKLFTYLMAGNAIIFSNTTAQSLFFKSYPQIGSMYHCGDIKNLTLVLKKYITNPSSISYQKEKAVELAREKYNWENESQIFLDQVQNILLTK